MQGAAPFYGLAEGGRLRHGRGAVCQPAEPRVLDGLRCYKLSRELRFKKASEHPDPDPKLLYNLKTQVLAVSVEISFLSSNDRKKTRALS